MNIVMKRSELCVFVSNIKSECVYAIVVVRYQLKESVVMCKWYEEI